MESYDPAEAARLATEKALKEREDLKKYEKKTNTILEIALVFSIVSLIINATVMLRLLLR